MQIQCEGKEHMAKMYNVQVADVNQQIQTLQQKLKDFKEGKDASATYVAQTKDELIALQDVIKQKLAKLMAQEE